LLPPLQETLVPEMVLLNAVGAVMVTDFVVVHALASVTVTVYVPAAKPVTEEVVFAGVVFQL
jgi:hypothetical protein